MKRLHEWFFLYLKDTTSEETLLGNCFPYVVIKKGHQKMSLFLPFHGETHWLNMLFESLANPICNYYPITKASWELVSVSSITQRSRNLLAVGDFLPIMTCAAFCLWRSSSEVKQYDYTRCSFPEVNGLRRTTPEAVPGVPLTERAGGTPASGGCSEALVSDWSLNRLVSYNKWRTIHTAMRILRGDI